MTAALPTSHPMRTIPSAPRSGSNSPELTEPLLESSPSIGIAIKACTGIRIQNLTIQGAADKDADRLLIGVRIESINSYIGSYAIQFQNVHFMWCAVCVQTAATNNNSELSFYDCNFFLSNIGFQCLNNQSLVNRFFGCIGGGGGGEDDGMETMFDLTYGGNITVVGFGGQNMRTFVRVGQGGPNIGWNIFLNVRLEAAGDWAENRIGSTTRCGRTGAITAFNGLLIVGQHETMAGVRSSRCSAATRSNSERGSKRASDRDADLGSSTLSLTPRTLVGRSFAIQPMSPSMPASIGTTCRLGPGTFVDCGESTIPTLLRRRSTVPTTDVGRVALLGGGRRPDGCERRDVGRWVGRAGRSVGCASRRRARVRHLGTR